MKQTLYLPVALEIDSEYPKVCAYLCPLQRNDNATQFSSGHTCMAFNKKLREDWGTCYRCEECLNQAKPQ